jgi:tripartite-type tricarboxylate transporter receptor subunit TctC
MKPIPQIVTLALAGALFVTPQASAQSGASSSGDDQNRMLTFYVGFPPGAAYDLYGRLVGRHIGDHLPGQPTVVMKNMPGASSLVLANTIANVFPRDGSVIGAVLDNVAVEPLVNERAKFDGRKLTWIGSVLKVTDTCMFWHGSKAKTIQDAMRHEVVVGASAPSGGSALAPRVLNAFIGTKFKIVPGYGGQELFLAMERGETEARCGMSWGGLKASRPDWLRDGKIKVVIQIALKKDPELADVPLVMDFVKNDDDRKAIEFLYATQEMGRPIVAPPGIPAAQRDALRSAFDRTMTDPQFLADAKRSNLEISPIPGSEVEAIVNRLYGTPKPIVDRVEALKNPVQK